VVQYLAGDFSDVLVTADDRELARITGAVAG
jgi:hypothetical protein